MVPGYVHRGALRKLKTGGSREHRVPESCILCCLCALLFTQTGNLNSTQSAETSSQPIKQAESRTAATPLRQRHDPRSRLTMPQQRFARAGQRSHGTRTTQQLYSGTTNKRRRFFRDNVQQVMSVISVNISGSSFRHATMNSLSQHVESPTSHLRTLQRNGPVLCVLRELLFDCDFR